MLLRKLAVVAAATMVLSYGVAAQTDAADAGSPPAKSGTSKRGSRASKARKAGASSAVGASDAATDTGAAGDAKGSASASKKGARSRKGKKAPPAKPSEPTVDEETRKALEAAKPTAPPTPAPAPAPAPAPEPSAVAEDNDPPSISHTPVAKAVRGTPLVITARVTDPSGVFGPVLYLRKKGMGTGEYIPIKMVGSKLTQGDYTVEVPPGLLGADTLEYYVEAWDNAGNGPSRAGAPENPFGIRVEDEKKQIVIARPSEPVAPPTTVTIKPKGAPPAIAHTAMTQATRGKNIEINARLVGDTGVQGATVLFRHVGETDFKALPMGDLGGDNWTATIPAGMTQTDLEYYLEAFDRFGNGPGRSGAPAAPYVIKVVEPTPTLPSVTINRSGNTTVEGGPRLLRAPFKANPGRAVGWLFMTGFVAGSVFAGGEALGALQTHSAYTHTFEYEGRLEPELLDRANEYSRRAKTAGIIAGSSLVVSIVLLIIFPEHPDTIVVGAPVGDVGFKF